VQAIEHWPLVQKNVIQLYDYALEKITREGRMTAERRQVYEMNRLEHELREQFSRSEKLRKRYLSWLWAVLHSAILIAAIVSQWQGKLDATFLGITGTVAGVLLATYLYIHNRIYTEGT
jgi:hypothetical protein